MSQRSDFISLSFTLLGIETFSCEAIKRWTPLLRWRCAPIRFYCPKSCICTHSCAYRVLA